MIFYKIKKLLTKQLKKPNENKMIIICLCEKKKIVLWFAIPVPYFIGRITIFFNN